MSRVRLIRPLVLGWLGWVALVTGCSEEPPLFIELPDIPPTVGFLLTFAKLDDPPVSVSSAFELGADAPIPASVAATDGQQIVLLTIDDARLGFTGVKRRAAPVTQYTLELNAEECAHGLLSRAGQDARLRIAASKAASAYSATIGEPRFDPLDITRIVGLAAASFTLPVEPGGCRPIPLDAAAAFDADHEFIIHEDLIVRGRSARPNGRASPEFVMYYLETLEDDRVVASTPAELLLLRRSGEFIDDASHRISPAEVPGLPSLSPGQVGTWKWVQLDYAPASGPGAGQLAAGLLLEIQSAEDEEVRLGFRSALVEVAVTPAGFSSVRTATVWNGELVDVVTSPQGEALAIWNEPLAERGSNRDAYVIRRVPSAGPWQSSRISSKIAARSIRATGDPRSPYLLGFSLGRLMLGDLSMDPPELTVLATDLTGDADALASHRTEDGLTVWVGTDRGNISVVTPQNRIVTPLLFRLPLEASSCAPNVDPCGWSSGTDRTLSLEHFPESGVLAATFQGCEAAVIFRTSDLCPSALPFPGRAEIGNSRAARYLRRTPDGMILYEVTSRTGVISVQ